MTDEAPVIQNQPDVTEAPSDGGVQVNDTAGDVTVQAGPGQAPVADGGARIASDEAK